MSGFRWFSNGNYDSQRRPWGTVVAAQSQDWPERAVHMGRTLREVLLQAKNFARVALQAEELSVELRQQNSVESKPWVGTRRDLCKIWLVV